MKEKHIRQNDVITKEEFDGLYRKYYEPLFFYAYGFVEDEEVCRDILSDVFERMWNRRSSLQRSSLSSFLYSCVRNGCIDHLRHGHASQQYADYLKTATADDDKMSKEEREALYGRLKEAIDRLPERTRYILTECYFEHKKYKEVALQLDISVNAIKMHIMKALSSLRATFSVMES